MSENKERDNDLKKLDKELEDIEYDANRKKEKAREALRNGWWTRDVFTSEIISINEEAKEKFTKGPLHWFYEKWGND